MKVLIAKKAGFCMGVRRAVDMTLDMVNRKNQNISTYGPLIHNPQVLDVLADKGVKVLTDVPSQEIGTVIIRAHGVPPISKQALMDSGLSVKDATCPRVVKVQAIINKHKKDNRCTVIIGDRNHAEVEGLLGFAGDDAVVVSNLDEARNLRLDKPYIIVSQTTQDEVSFAEMTEAITSQNPDGLVFNTICDSTHKRQDEVRNLCARVEALVVVGGKNSANTKRLAEIAESLGKRVMLVETEAELDPAALKAFSTVGVTAGASTPSWMINRVVRALEAIPGRGEGGFAPLLYRALWLIMSANIYVSFGGALLVYICGRLLGEHRTLFQAAMAFGYLFAMHNFNRLTDQSSKIFNDPAQVRFYKQHYNDFLSLSIGALLVTLALGIKQGASSFLLLLTISVFGLLYSVHFIPEAVASVVKVKRLKEIPGSKTFFIALAWAIMVVTIPAMDAGGSFNLAHFFTFAGVLVFVFIRNALYDVFEVQGDKIAGKETLPVFIGEEKTLRVLSILIVGLCIFSLLGPGLGILRPTGYFLLPGIFYLFILTRLYQKKTLNQGVKLEFALESVFVILAASVYVGELFVSL